MADHNKPVLTSTYTNFVSEIDARFDDLAVGLDPAVTSATNVPIGTIRWNSALSKDQKWNGSAWVDKTTVEVFPTLQASTIQSSGNITAGGTSATASVVVNAVGTSNPSGGTSIVSQTNGTATVAIGNVSNLLGGGYDATPMLYGNTTLKVFTGGISGTFTSAGFSSPSLISDSASKSGKSTYGLELVTNSTSLVYKIATLPASTAGTYDQMRITGIMGGWSAANKRVLDVICASRDSLVVQVLQGVFTPSNKILFYRETDGSVSVWSSLASFQTQGLDLVGTTQVTTYNQPITGTPTGTLVFDTSTAVPATTVDSAGNFGLGAYTNAWNDGILNAKAAEIGGNRPYYIYSDGTGTSYTGTNAWYTNQGTAGWRYTHDGLSFNYSEGANGCIWNKANSGTANSIISYYQLMKIDPSNNLVVGQGEAQYATGGRGNITISGTTQAILSFGINGNAAGYLYSDDITTTLGAPSGRSVKININGDRATFTPDGKLLLGTSLSGYQNSNSIAMEAPLGYTVMNHVSGTTGGTAYTFFGYAGNGVGGIYQNGTTGIILNGGAHLNLTGSIVTAPTVSASDNSASIATTAFVKSQALGASQTWQTVTRSSGVTYTNSTGRPIVLVWVASVSSSSYSNITVGSVEVSYAQGHTAVGIPVQCTAIIPAGSTYTPFTNGSLVSAVELR
jgi:hypothetical protein